MRHSALALALVAAVLFMMSGEVAAGRRPRCQSSCKTCWRDNKCKTCKDGWYRDSWWKCQKCSGKIQGCSKCKWWHGEVYCTKCQKGYFWEDGTCQKAAHCPAPYWDHSASQWSDVRYQDDHHQCQQCTCSGDHWGWCKECDSHNPSWCKRCEDGSDNHHPMYTDGNGECQFCTAIWGDSCLACKWDDSHQSAFCTKCDQHNGWVPDGHGGCTDNVV